MEMLLQLDVKGETTGLYRAVTGVRKQLYGAGPLKFGAQNIFYFMQCMQNIKNSALLPAHFARAQHDFQLYPCVS